MQNIRLSAALALAAVLTGGVAPVARADMKVVESVTFDNPQIKKMMANLPASQRSMAANSRMSMMDGRPIPLTIWSSGKKFRSDMMQRSVIIDGAANKMTMLDSAGRFYQTMPYMPPTGKYAPGANAGIRDTGQTKMILGHKARHYAVEVSPQSKYGATVKGDIWAAADLPQPAMAGPAGGPIALLGDKIKAVKGMPLTVSLVMSGSPAGGDITIKSVVQSISMSKLPASTFAIPAGYKQAPTGVPPPVKGMPRK
jgi:hypothetical protein